MILCDDRNVVVSDDNRLKITHRYAVRILRKSGCAEAVAQVPFIDGAEAVVSNHAWIVRGGRQIKPKNKVEWLDVTLEEGRTVYTEARMMRADYTDFVIEGDVFGYETVVVGDLHFAQMIEQWAGSHPAIERRFRLQLPEGWTVHGQVTGSCAGEVSQEHDRQTWMWSLMDTPYQKVESCMPGGALTAAQLMLDIRPAANAGKGLKGIYKNWQELVNWMTSLQEGECDSNAELEAEVRRLASNTNRLQNIRSIARYVQGLRYISYQEGLSIGHGYKPRKATEVHAKGWGDCKDKANLMRSMLRTLGIDSYIMAVHSTEGRNLQPGWPSPKQFNHVILGIKTGDDVDLPGCIKLGDGKKLLVFDPTDPVVAIGDLPVNLQGAKALLLDKGASDPIVSLPLLAAKPSHSSNRKIVLNLAADGSVQGTYFFEGTGSVGAAWRGRERYMSVENFTTAATQSMKNLINGVIIGDIHKINDPDGNAFRMDYTFSSKRFSQRMAGGFMTVNLDLSDHGRSEFLSAMERRLPIGLGAVFDTYEITLAIPEGYILEDLPECKEVRSRYGSYLLEVRSEGSRIRLQRTLQMDDQIASASEFERIKQFFAEANSADHLSLVLLKAPAE